MCVNIKLTQFTEKGFYSLIPLAVLTGRDLMWEYLNYCQFNYPNRILKADTETNSKFSPHFCSGHW